MKIQTTTITQTANEILGTKEKILYYLILENNRGGKITLNVGAKTHEGVKALLEEDTNTGEHLNKTKK